MTAEPVLPGVPLDSGFDYHPASEFDALHLAPADMKAWQEWLDDVYRKHRRAQVEARNYVIGSADSNPAVAQDDNGGEATP